MAVADEAAQAEGQLHETRQSSAECRQSFETMRQALEGLRQQIEGVGLEVQELRQRVAQEKRQADLIDEETRVTHRMLRRVRDELRETEASVPQVEVCPPHPVEATAGEPPGLSRRE